MLPGLRWRSEAMRLNWMASAPTVRHPGHHCGQPGSTGIALSTAQAHHQKSPPTLMQGACADRLVTQLRQGPAGHEDLHRRAALERQVPGVSAALVRVGCS